MWKTENLLGRFLAPVWDGPKKDRISGTALQCEKRKSSRRVEEKKEGNWDALRLKTDTRKNAKNLWPLKTQKQPCLGTRSELASDRSAFFLFEKRQRGGKSEKWEEK